MIEWLLGIYGFAVAAGAIGGIVLFVVVALPFVAVVSLFCIVVDAATAWERRRDERRDGEGHGRK